MLLVNVREEKRRLRARYKKLRAQCPADVKQRLDKALTANLLGLAEYRDCETLFIFVSSPIECETRGIILDALEKGKKVAVPRCADRSGRMDFYYIRSLDELSPGTFSLLEPDPEKCERVADLSNGLCVVPGLCFDLEGYRAKMNGQGVDEAPWIKTRAQELRPIEIRGTEKFANPEKKKGKRFAGAKHVVEATLPPLQTAPSASHRLGPALVIGAAILTLGGAWCTVRLVNSLRESSAEHAAVSAVELPAAPSRGEDIVDFADTRRLTSGWIASLQFSEKQDVRQDGNAKTKATVFRLTSETNGVIRFSKTMLLFDRPQKVYYTVKLATTTRPGVAVQFGFASRVRFLDADGKLLSEDLHTAARSVSNRAVKVPPGAETAELWIDCRCIGTFDIDVPLFKKEPVSRRKK